MAGFMRLLAVLVALVFVLTLPATILAFDIGQVLFSEDRIKPILVDQLTATDELRQTLVTSFLSGSGAEPINPGGFDLVRSARSLSPGQVVELTNLLLPDAWFRDQIGGVVTGIYGWIDSDQTRPLLTIDLRPLKLKLVNGGARQLMQLLIDSWPQCLPGQNSQIEQAMLSSKPPPILYCKPSSSLRDIYTERTSIWLTNRVPALPDTLSLVGEGASAPPVPDLTALKARIRLTRDLARWAWMIPASILGMIMALAIRSWPGLTRWWGIPLALGGIFSLAPIPFAKAFEGRLLRELPPGEALPPVVKDALASAAGGIRVAVLQALAAQAILLVLLGAGLAVVGWLLDRRGLTRRSVRVDSGDSGFPPGLVEQFPVSASQPEAEDFAERPTGIFG